MSSILSAVLLVALLACGVCGAAADTRDCGTVVAEANNDLASFSPLFAANLGDSRAAQLLFQPLVWVDRHGQVNWTRSLASAIKVSPDTLRYTVTLRPWAWSDGVPVTAGDVVYDWRMIEALGENYPDYGSGGIPGQIASITAPDATHLLVVLNAPANAAWFVDNGLAQLVALPEHAWRHLSVAALYQNQSEPRFFSVVDGPMRVEKLDVGMDAVFVPNPSYPGPPAHFRRLVLMFTHSDGAALQEVEAGDLDFAPVPLELFSALGKLRGVHVERLGPVSFWYYLALNLRNPSVAFFRDVRVRQAIQDAIDQQAVIRLIYHGFGKAIYTPIPAVDAGLLAPPLAAGDYPVGHDPARARALLAAAGFAPDGHGIFAKDGRELAFTTLIASDSTEGLETMVMLQAELHAAGIRLELHEITFNQMDQELQNEPAAWQAASLGTVLNPYPSGEGNFATGAGQNAGGYSDPVMDRLIAASIGKPGLAGLYGYEVYAAAQQPVIFLPTEDHVDLVSNRIHGVDGFSDGGLLAPDALWCGH